ncbi:hypothetical protein DFS34DRAFT_648097 [Phlyctochytrium arcticum]|nr:hypothetical protein DFS34DRAFT_648097 [Phlyctochytrium arcticum]
MPTRPPSMPIWTFTPLCSPIHPRTLLDAAWTQDPQTALRCIFHLRDIRSGKGDADKFSDALLWLYRRHPETLLANLRWVPRVGYWKDLLNYLVRVTIEEDAHAVSVGRIRDCQQQKSHKTAMLENYQSHHNETLVGTALRHGKRSQRLAKERQSGGVKRDLQKIIQLNESAMRVEQEKASELRREKRAAQSKNLATRFVSDSLYRRILANDAKPGPTESWSNFVVRVRIKYNKAYIVPLRKHTKVVETHLGYGQAGEINYEHVPAHSMRRNRPKFQELDEERFTEYLGAVSKGEKTIAAGSLKPHQLVSEVWSSQWDCENLVEDESADTTLLRENQWNSYVQRIKKVGHLKHATAIGDVSGSTMGEPLDVCIALGLLCSQVAEPPFDGLLCTFSQTPEFFKVPTAGTLKDKVEAIADMQWDMNTNFEAVFDLLLQTAIGRNLPANEMVSTLLVFSDMEFDEATDQAGTWTTLHDGAAAKFATAGYTLPSIVYWNLRGKNRSTGNAVSFPAVNSTKGVAMVSGFSGQMLKLFMDGDMDFTPSKIMTKSLDPYTYSICEL